MLALFCWLFADLFQDSVEKEITVRGTPGASFPSPLLPSVLAATLTLLVAALALLGTWVLAARKDPEGTRVPLWRFRGNTELGIQLVLLAAVLSIGTALPSSVRFATCRCCLFTVNEVCKLLKKDTSSIGFYDRVSGLDGFRYTGIYPNFSHEDLEIRRTRFGWPFQTITLDVVQSGKEWYLVRESWWCPDLFLIYLMWLCLHPIVVLARRALRNLVVGA